MPAAIPTSLSSPAHATSVWITIDNVKVPIYNVQTENNKISGIFESIEGSNFVVHYMDNQIKPKDSRVVELDIDGKPMESVADYKNDSLYKEEVDCDAREMKFSGVSDSSGQERPFVFKKATLTDDDEIACQDEHILKNLGVIVINVWRATVERKKTKKYYASDTAIEENIIHESFKKATLSHQVGYGDSIASSNPRAECTSKTTILDPEDSPSLAFELKCMSRALLEMNGYVKAPKQDKRKRRSISPTPVQSISRELEEEEKRELAEAEAATQAVKDKIAKRKVDSLNGNVAEKRVKVEEGEAGRKIKKEGDVGNLGVIVLTDSEDED